MTLTVTDMFCGAGGSSIGVTAAGASVRLAMNHWPVAIDTHSRNFPGIDHACVNVATSDPAYFPTTDILIASPECKAHTYSGGRKRNRQHPTLFDLDERDRRKREAEARSRATMLDVPRWAEHHDYAAIIVENVLEIFDWILIEEWFSMMAKLGYRWQIKSFNSMFFGGGQFGPRPPQSRNRPYIVFTKAGNPLPDLDYRPRAWCPRCDADVDAVQAFNSNRSRGSYRQQYRYRCPTCAAEALPYVAPAAGIIDWSLACPPIGERRRPLANSTIARIRAYLKRHGFDPALVPVTHTSRNGKVEVKGQLPRSVLEPARTQTAQPEAALAWPFVDTARRNAAGRTVDLPLTAVSAEGNHHYLVEPFIDTARTNNAPRPVSVPMPVLSTGNHHYLVFPERGYVVGNYSPGWLRDADRLPLGAITTRDHHAMLVPSGGSWRTDGWPVNRPMRTVLTTESDALVRLPADFLLPYNGKPDARPATGRSSLEPVGALSSHDRYALASPNPTAARDLDGFIQACGYRMLTAREVGKAMAFPETYEVTGTKDEQVAQYGNAVTPPVMSWVFKRVAESLNGAAA